MNKITASIKNNLPGALIGGAAAFLGAKKFAGIKNIWILGGIAVAGALAGSAVQAKIKAHSSVPTKATVKK